MMELSKLSDGYQKEYSFYQATFDAITDEEKKLMPHGSYAIILGAAGDIDQVYWMSHVNTDGTEDEIGHFVPLL